MSGTGNCPVDNTSNIKSCVNLLCFAVVISSRILSEPLYLIVMPALTISFVNWETTCLPFNMYWPDFESTSATICTAKQKS